MTTNFKATFTEADLQDLENRAKEYLQLQRDNKITPMLLPYVIQAQQNDKILAELKRMNEFLERISVNTAPLMTGKGKI